MPGQHVGPGHTGVVQQGVQVGGDPGTVLGAVGGVAPAAPGAVIHADPGVAGHGGGDQRQRRGHLARAGLEDHSRGARPGAAQVHPVPVDVDQLPGHGVHTGVEGLACRLISGADRHEAQHGEHGGDDPPPGAAVQLAPGLHEHPDHQGEKHGGPHPGQHIVDERGGADEDQRPGQAHEHRRCGGPALGLVAESDGKPRQQCPPQGEAPQHRACDTLLSGRDERSRGQHHRGHEPHGHRAHDDPSDGCAVVVALGTRLDAGGGCCVKGLRLER